MASLDADDALVAFSDGVVEALNGDGAEFGEEPLLPAVTLYPDSSAALFRRHLQRHATRASTSATPTTSAGCRHRVDPGDNGRVALLITIRGCHQDPCVLVLNLTRTGQSAFEI